MPNAERVPWRAIGCVALLAMLTTGCVSRNLTYVHNAVLGVDLTLGTEGTARLAIGYDSDTFAIVPRDDETREAMTLVSVSNVDVDGIDEIVFDHVVVTGEAAVKAAQDPAGLKLMRQAVFGEESAAAKLVK